MSSFRLLENVLAKRARRWSAPGLAVLAALALTGCQKSEPPPAPPATKTAATASTPPASATTSAAVPETVNKLLGRWLRADGGYVLELRKAELSGALEAAYFNPKSIHISRSVWMQGGGGFQVAVELNDVGYPGATYVLTYDAQNDRLAGKYNQPAMQQSFDVEFVRQPR